MGDVYTEDGERLDWVGMNENQIRGTVGTDGMGRYDIGGETLYSLLPDEIEYDDFCEYNGGSKGTEYLFYVSISVYKPSGEYRE